MLFPDLPIAEADAPAASRPNGFPPVSMPVFPSFPVQNKAFPPMSPPLVSAAPAFPAFPVIPSMSPASAFPVLPVTPSPQPSPVLPSVSPAVEFPVLPAAPSFTVPDSIPFETFQNGVPLKIVPALPETAVIEPVTVFPKPAQMTTQTLSPAIPAVEEIAEIAEIAEPAESFPAPVAAVFPELNPDVAETAVIFPQPVFVESQESDFSFPATDALDNPAAFPEPAVIAFPEPAVIERPLPQQELNLEYASPDNSSEPAVLAVPAAVEPPENAAATEVPVPVAVTAPTIVVNTIVSPVAPESPQAAVVAAASSEPATPNRSRFDFDEDLDEIEVDEAKLIDMWDNIEDSAVEVRQSGNIKGWYEKLFIQARSVNTSDLHLETFCDDNAVVNELRIRARVDGSLLPFRRITGDDAARIIGVIKTNATGMSTSGSTVQESQIVIPLDDDTQFETRATIAPKADGGEILNVRLPIEGDIKPLAELGMSEENLRRFRHIIGHPHGLVLVAGPTGSGKTTTIHAALIALLRPSRTIFTLEDPVERFIPGMVQIEVSSGSGSKQSFSDMLPYMVRFDYDMLFLGEIRDTETAKTAIKQAQIGKMVFATIHANDNVVALQRLITLVEEDAAYVLDSVRGVVSQRLVAKRNPEWDHKNPVTRYKGRTPIHEVTEVTPNVVQGFVEKLKFSDLRSSIRDEQDSNLAMDAMRLLEERVTDVREVRRVLGDRFMSDLKAAEDE
jgi:general secretion pathway protein E